MTGAGWHSVHVHYHGDDRGLVLDAVRPLFRRLAGLVTGAHHLRHWRQGPQLRLNLRTTPDRFAEVVLPAVDELIGGYLRARPSTRRLDPAAVLPEHRRLAALEDERGPLEPWCPDNSFHVAPYDDRVHVLGTPEMAGLLAGFYADTTDLAFDLTEGCAGAGSLLAAAFDLVVATAHTLTEDGIGRGFVSLRSHAEGFLSLDPRGPERRAAWEAHRRRHADALAARLHAVVTEPGRVPYVPDWVAALGRHRARARALLAAGTFVMPYGEAAAEERLGRASPFHRALFADPDWAARRASPGFALSRLALNTTYLHLTRLGIAPAERFLLCHLAAGTVEDSFAPLQER
ncbi:thiopeptide maturation pyridine synthase [Nonomuraea sp. NPDC050310]|uniref:thiopeptide maturation pyridine synthase n=1 Tax=Nonomuraea sp. NPDC050310 TaxID=3154935 RepID=UPI0033FC14C8